MQNVTSEQIVKSLSNVFKVSLKVMGGFHINNSSGCIKQLAGSRLVVFILSYSLKV